MKLSSYLAERGMTAMAFAKKCGISRSEVSRLRSGERLPSAKLAVLIAKKTRNAVGWADWKWNAK